MALEPAVVLRLMSAEIVEDDKEATPLILDWIEQIRLEG